MCLLTWSVIRTKSSCFCAGRTRLKVLAAMSACSTTWVSCRLFGGTVRLQSSRYFLAAGVASLGRRLVTGDVIKGTVIGNTITAYINGVQIYRATDSMWTSGQPGIGFFKRTAGLNSDLAITSYTATSL